jgi:glycerol-3-phosphate dehydrogenase
MAFAPPPRNSSPTLFWIGVFCVFSLGLFGAYDRLGPTFQITEQPMTLNQIRDLEEHLYAFPKRGELKSITRLGRNFEITVLGGGALGGALCLESILRGYKTACLSPNDFSMGTLGKPQPLGGVDEFSQCMIGLNPKACLLGAKAIKNRYQMVEMAPQLIQEKFISPHYTNLNPLVQDLVLRGYDVFSIGVSLLTLRPMWPDRFYREGESLTLKDGAISENRLGLALYLTAIKHGAVALDHLIPMGFDKPGALQVQDSLTGEQWAVSGKAFLQVLPAPHAIKGTIEIQNESLLNLFSTARSAMQTALSEVPSLNSKKHDKKKNLMAQTKLVGSQGFSSYLAQDLMDSYNLSSETANHLARTYGGLSLKILDISWERNLFSPIHKELPYLWSEVIYMMRHEYAATPMDIFFERLDFTSLDTKNQDQVYQKLTSFMAGESHGDEQWRSKQISAYNQYKKNHL